MIIAHLGKSLLKFVDLEIILIVNSSSILFIWFSPFIYYVKKVYWNTYNQLFLRVVGIFLSQISKNSLCFLRKFCSENLICLFFPAGIHSF